MAGIPGWLKGKHLTAVTVIGYTEGADNVLTAAATSSLSGVVDYIRFSSDPVHSMIMSVDRNVANYEIDYDDFDIIIGEILKKKIVTPSIISKLPTLLSSYDRFSISFTRGGSTFQMWATRGRLGDGVGSVGKNTAEANFRPFDPGGTTPTVVFTE